MQARHGCGWRPAPRVPRRLSLGAAAPRALARARVPCAAANCCLLQEEPRPRCAPAVARRYVILVYRQPGPVNFVEAKLSITKFMFDLEEWTGKLRLGDPVAASYFTCEYEPGCHASCLLSALCCAFCCWTTPSRDFHRRARESGGNTGAAPPRARRGGAPDESVHMA